MEDNIWDEFETAMCAFESFLHDARSGGALQDWHVIFDMGTVARFNINSAREFGGYDSEYLAKWSHRDDIIENIEYATMIWNEQSLLAGQEGKVVRCAYNILIRDGYPIPGTNDIVPVPLQMPDDSAEYLWSLIWTNRSVELTNLAIANNMLCALIIGSECRRRDFLIPRVRAVISPDLVVTRLY